jgi:hypothetical protein
MRGFSGFDLERWNCRENRRLAAMMCNARAVLRSSEEDEDLWSSDEENSTRTTSK